MSPAARVIRFEDADYPERLRAVKRPPPALFVEGSLTGLDRAIGIVGTRRATPAALELTRTIARGLAERGVVVVSGGAEGVDREAHEGALDVPGGRTIAALPTALASPYPRSHAALFARIAQHGARLSEHAHTAQPQKAYFLERNRIIAALSRGVIVIQAPWKSGALRTAHDAMGLGLRVLACPWSPSEPAAAGGLELLAKGAGLCRNLDDALTLLGETAPGPTRAKKTRAMRSGDEATLLAMLDDVAIDREALVARSGWSASRVQTTLLELVLDGVVIEDARGVRRR